MIKQEKEKVSLYIHIPFCVRKCLYCDFLSMSWEEDEKEQYVDVLLRELGSWKKILGKYRIQTIFVGGGTPTCLSPAQLEMFTQGLLQILSGLEVAKDLEFTIEANPGTVLKEHIPILQRAGINRVSLGLQSAQNRELQALGRIHSYQEFLATYDLLRENGFSNINIDIMSDIPLQSLESYTDTLTKVIALQPEHISAYSLIVEEGTPFYDMAEKGKLEIPSEEVDRQMYQKTEEILKEAGYDRYEISNYAKPGRECRHNLTYWNTREYLGVGLGASSCLGGYRFQNRRDWSEYLSCFNRVRDFGNTVEDLMTSAINYWKETKTINENKADKTIPLPFQEIESLTENARKEEFMFMGLRKMEGVSVKDFQERFGESVWEVYRDTIPELIDKNLLEAKGDNIYLTRQGIDVSNVVMAEFLF